jgi:surface antigen
VSEQAAPSAPISGGDQTECALSPVQTLTATATAPAGSSVVWYDAMVGGNVVANPDLNVVGTIIYYAESVEGSLGCVSNFRTAVTFDHCEEQYDYGS